MHALRFTTSASLLVNLAEALLQTRRQCRDYALVSGDDDGDGDDGNDNERQIMDMKSVE